MNLELLKTALAAGAIIASILTAGVLSNLPV